LEPTSSEVARKFARTDTGSDEADEAVGRMSPARGVSQRCQGGSGALRTSSGELDSVQIARGDLPCYN
jgi:hypothetical protein